MKIVTLIILGLSFTILAGACGPELISDQLHSHSTNLVQIEGVPNFHKVSNDLYRSAQPTAKGLQNLRAMGIRTVVDLRWLHSDRNEIGDTGLGYEHIHMKAWHPEEKQIVKFLQIVTDTKRTPVLVHCQYGADRTGTMCAIYGISVQGWTKEEALKEMTGKVFGFHGIWDNLAQWVNKVDIEKIKEEAGITQSRAPVAASAADRPETPVGCE